MRNSIATLAGATALLAMGLLTSSDVFAKGPQLSVDVEAYCGDPVAMDPATGEPVIVGYDSYGLPILATEPIVVFLTDVSDDPNPIYPPVDSIWKLEVACYVTMEGAGKVKGPGNKPSQLELQPTFSYEPAFFADSPFQLSCNFDGLSDEDKAKVLEWKVTATVTDPRIRTRTADCEEVLFQGNSLTGAPAPTETSVTEVIVAEEPVSQ